MNSRSVATAMVAVSVLGAVPTAHAVFTLYPTRAAFNLAAPGLPLEDFEEARVPVAGFLSVTNPLDQFTNDAIFLPGEILPGLRVTDVGDTRDLSIAANGFANYVSDTVTTNFGPSNIPLEVSFFGPAVTSVGLDVTHNPAGDTVFISAFSGATLIVTQPLVGVGGGGSFFGITNDAPITRLEITSDFDFYGLDNVAFGNIPEPGSLGLVALASAALMTRRRTSR